MVNFQAVRLATPLCAIKIPVVVHNWAPFVAILIVWLVLMAFVRRRD
jgi:hypothetical protein